MNTTQENSATARAIAQEHAARIHAQLSASDFEAAIHEFRQQVRNRGREISYSEARNQVRQSRPGYFGC